MKHLKKAIKGHIFKVILFIVIMTLILIQMEKSNSSLLVNSPDALRSYFSDFGIFSAIQKYTVKLRIESVLNI